MTTEATAQEQLHGLITKEVAWEQLICLLHASRLGLHILFDFDRGSLGSVDSPAATARNLLILKLRLLGIRRSFSRSSLGSIDSPAATAWNQKILQLGQLHVSRQSQQL